MLCLLVDFIVGYIENIFKQIFKRLSKNRQSSSMTLYNNQKNRTFCMNHMNVPVPVPV